MGKLDRSEPYNWPRALSGAADDTVRRPLWEFPPEAVGAVKHERRRRFKWDIDSEGERGNG